MGTIMADSVPPEVALRESGGRVFARVWPVCWKQNPCTRMVRIVDGPVLARSSLWSESPRVNDRRAAGTAPGVVILGCYIAGEQAPSKTKTELVPHRDVVETE
jgi:hypothetical protein